VGKAARKETNHLLGTSWVLGAALFFTAMNLFSRYMRSNPAGEPIPSAEKAFFRLLVPLVLLAPLAFFGLQRIIIGNPRLLALRGSLGAVMVLLYFHAIDHTTLARATFFLYTYIAWGALFSHVFLGEPLGRRRLPGIIIVYGGALLMLADKGKAQAVVTWHGDMAGIVSGVVAGAAATSMRALHRYTSSYMIFLTLCLFGTTLSGAVTLITGAYVVPSTLEWVLLAAIGATGTAAHLCLTTGFRYLDVATVGALEMAAAPMTAAAAFIILGEAAGPLTVTGGVILLAGGAYLAVTTRAPTLRRASDPDAATP